MRAMVMDAPKPAEHNPLQLREMETPRPAPGQIRVLVNCCGLCHTDLHTVEGDLPLPKLPIIPGHQIVGIVESLGANANKFSEGDRVGIPWLFSTDGTCQYCRSGSENLCGNARFTGYHINGGYAEQVVVHEDFAYKIPANFSDE